jgi:hypothetical protein
MALAALIAVGVAVYAYDVWRHPWRRCGLCEGSSKKDSKLTDTFGNCRRCKGAGRKLRRGARILRIQP